MWKYLENSDKKAKYQENPEVWPLYQKCRYQQNPVSKIIYQKAKH